MQQTPRPGTIRQSKADWSRGHGQYSYRGELWRGKALMRKQLNRKVRHTANIGQHSNYKHVTPTNWAINFS